jgi:hypothetical protein
VAHAEKMRNVEVQANSSAFFRRNPMNGKGKTEGRLDLFSAMMVRWQRQLMLMESTNSTKAKIDYKISERTTVTQPSMPSEQKIKSANQFTLRSLPTNASLAKVELTASKAQGLRVSSDNKAVGIVRDK